MFPASLGRLGARVHGHGHVGLGQAERRWMPSPVIATRVPFFAGTLG